MRERNNRPTIRPFILIWLGFCTVWSVPAQTLSIHCPIPSSPPLHVHMLNGALIAFNVLPPIHLYVCCYSLNSPKAVLFLLSPFRLSRERRSSNHASLFRTFPFEPRPHQSLGQPKSFSVLQASLTQCANLPEPCRGKSIH
ncbi:hypothetical protein BD410DRAFT_416955 [Rickenella mellea]|uniref:Secreted protein n=1 Tax=Rickenella mellea TaxID=50990 RepID=A0A4Y7QJV5_9AGAM|nr:hypothetical protein BD410DRAFT_416955 [Rickenella mellea]